MIKDHITVHVGETNTERQIIYYAAHNAQRRQGRKSTNLYWTGSWKVRVIRNREPTPDGAKKFAPATTRLQPKILLISRHRQSGGETKILGSLFLTLRVKNGPVDQRRDDYQEANRTNQRLNEEHGKGNTRLHAKDQVRQRRSQQFKGCEEGSERVDPKTGWSDHPSTSSSSPSWQAVSWWKSSSWNERYFFERTQGVFAYRQWTSPCQRRWVYTGHQTRTQCHVPAHVIFLAHCSMSRLVISPYMHNTCMWLKSQWSVVFTKKHLSSHSAQHGAQYTSSDDSAIIEHFLTSHLHSNPPVDQTINGTSADFIFWRYLPLRRSNKYVFRFLGQSSRAYRLWAQRSCRRRQYCAG